MNLKYYELKIRQVYIVPKFGPVFLAVLLLDKDYAGAYA